MASRSDILAVAEPQIKSDEGFRDHAYPDPLSGAEPYTIGWGQTGPNIGPDTVWTQDEAQADFDSRINASCDALDSHIPWWTSLDAVRAAVLLNMDWNLGTSGLMGFPTMLGCCERGDWAGASAAMLDSKWARQVPNRAQRLATQMETGETT